MLHRDLKSCDSPDINDKIFNVRQSLKQRLRSLRKRSKNESPLEYFPMDFIEEKRPESCSMTNEVLNNEIRIKLLDAVRYLGVQGAFEQMQTGEMNVDMYKTTSRSVRNMAFLWAAYIGRLDYMQALHELGAEIEFCYEVENFNALHLSALGGSKDCCEWLISKGCRFQLTNKGLSALHYAAFGDSKDCVEFLIESGCELSDTVVNSAVYANSVECLEFLLKHNLEITAYDQDGMAPIHVAADQASIACLDLLLNHPSCNVNLKTNDERNCTALHLAAENGYDQCIKMLFECGANLNEINNKKNTALHLACKMQYPDCVEFLVTNKANTNVRNIDERTPLHCAFAKSRLALPIVQMLVEWQADVNASDRYGYTPLHLAALNELDECVEYLIMNGSNVAAKTKAGLTALNVINRKTPMSVSKIPRRLNLSLAYNAEQSLKFSFRDIITNSAVGEVDYLYTLQKEGQAVVLKHPLCRAFLYLKWQKVRPYYLVRVGLSVIAILLLSMYIMIKTAHEECNRPSKLGENSSSISEPNYSSIAVDNPSSTQGENHSDAPTDPRDEKCAPLGILEKYTVMMDSMRIIIMIFVVLNIIRIILSLPAYRSVSHYFFKMYNILELSITIGIFITCLSNREPLEYKKHVISTLTILFSWVYLMIMVGQMPSFGAYISMFTKVLIEFSKLLIAYFSLLIGFTVTLCVLFPAHDIFKNPLIGFVKVITMMTGEINLDDLFKNINETHIKFTLCFVLVLFVLFVTVVLMNLLVGIAVHDVEGLHKTADLTKLVHQTQLIHFLELTCFNGFFPKNVSDMFQDFLYVAPKMYRVVIYVRPLNPHEKRLPKNIMEEGLKIALDRSKARSLKNAAKPDMESRIDSLEKEIKKLQTIINDMSNNVKNLAK